MVAVVWLAYHDHVEPRRMWDQAMLNTIFDRTLWRPPAGHDYEHHLRLDDLSRGTAGAVVVVGGRFHAADTARLTDDLARFGWVLLIITSDEGREFDWRQIVHPNMRVWLMTPDPARDEGADRYLGSGWAPGTPDVLARLGDVPRDLGWTFAGQVTHVRRRACVRAARRLPGEGRLVETAGFTQGVPQDEYLGLLARAQIAPCPSGPLSPDSFRAFEALEAGCVPVLDGQSPAGGKGYWDMLFGAGHPLPVVREWSEMPALARGLRRGWQGRATRMSAWWQAYKRDLTLALDDDVTALSGEHPEPRTPADLISVLVTTSPIPSHPDTSILDATLASVRAQPALQGAEIFVLCDGVRPEMEDRRPAYEEYVHRVVRACELADANLLPVVFDRHEHQTGMIRRALSMIRTPLIMHVEHDTPLVGDIPWDGICGALTGGHANVVRLHHEASVHPEHQHLMLDGQPVLVGGLPLLRTVQWSSRPHVASADYYRRILAGHFAAGERMFVEDRMHSVVQVAYDVRGDAGWMEHRLWMYAPEGDMKRSTHLDGRAGDPKWD